ncbi:MAG: hypothetical protein HZA22_04540 [Nitrospirae bacterium]|nr:hypothetical protein [Nitrospirota bacterium]
MPERRSEKTWPCTIQSFSGSYVHATTCHLRRESRLFEACAVCTSRGEDFIEYVHRALGVPKGETLKVPDETLDFFGRIFADYIPALDRVRQVNLQGGFYIGT